MSVISRRLVRARKAYECDAIQCNQGGRIVTGERYVRLYGSAHSEDPKYVLRIHLGCDEGASKND